MTEQENVIQHIYEKDGRIGVACVYSCKRRPISGKDEDKNLEVKVDVQQQMHVDPTYRPHF